VHVLLRQAVGRLLAEQDGVVARSQLLAAGATEADLRRALRRRDLTAIHEGVYVDHTGPPTWRQRAWAAVLAVQPAALYDVSALRALDGPGRRSHRDDALIHVAEAADALDAVAALADVVQGRLTTADRLLGTLAERPRIARRAFLDGVLRDIAAGTCSVLEHGYLTLVERPHGLPRAARQLVARGPAGRAYRDAAYPGQRQLVELDGRLFHEGVRARDRDLDRDLDAAASGEDTVRLGWGQVFGRPCVTATRLAAVLRLRGWAGPLLRCRRCPAPSDETVPAAADAW
jgi:hypothetical protein